MKGQLILITGFLFMFQGVFALDYCSGTEPFWNAQVSPQEIILKDIVGSSTSTKITTVSSVAGFTLDFMQVYSNSNGPVAVVTSNQCNDSMSDYIYPQEIILFTGERTLYGCCGTPINESEIEKP